MIHRRSSAVAALVAALTLFPAAAQARAHRHHETITGVVRSINVATHTMTLMVVVRGHRGRHDLRLAADARRLLMQFNISVAQVTGNHGAVAIGDRVTVTWSAGGRSPDVTHIAVIGVPNGGDGGKGAAVAGVITAIDENAGTFTMTQGDSASDGASVVVAVGSTTIFGVADVDHDGQVGLDELSVGDRVVVFTADATADPAVALGVLDCDHLGRNHHEHGGGGGGGGGEPTEIDGKVTAVDAGAGTLTMLVPPGDDLGTGDDGWSQPGSDWQQVTVTVTPTTEFGGRDLDGDGQLGLDDVSVGDVVTVLTDDSGTSVTALALGDHGQPPQPPHPPGPVHHFQAQVTAVDVSAGTLTVTFLDGPAQTVDVQLTADARVLVADTNGDGQTNLADVEVGDYVAVYFTGDFGSSVTAVGIYDRTNPPGYGVPHDR